MKKETLRLRNKRKEKDKRYLKLNALQESARAMHARPHLCDNDEHRTMTHDNFDNLQVGRATPYNIPPTLKQTGAQ